MRTVAKGLGGLALAMLATGCASTRGASPKPFPMPAPAARAPRPTPATPRPDPATPRLDPAGRPPAALVEAYALVDTALQLRGIPYRNGGSDLVGFDCSGFTQYVFARHHIALPRDVQAQFKVGSSITMDDVRPGDLLFFSTTTPGASHVAISLGADDFVHAPSSTGVVRIERLSTAYWAQRYIGARRVTSS